MLFKFYTVAVGMVEGHQWLKPKLEDWWTCQACFQTCSFLNFRRLPHCWVYSESLSPLGQASHGYTRWISSTFYIVHSHLDLEVNYYNEHQSTKFSFSVARKRSHCHSFHLFYKFSAAFVYIYDDTLMTLEESQIYWKNAGNILAWYSKSALVCS